MKSTNQTHEDISVILTKIALILAIIMVGYLSINGQLIVLQISMLPSPFFTYELRYDTLIFTGYLTAFLCIICIYYLFRLVTNIGNEAIFIPENVHYLQVIGWIVGVIALIGLFVGITCFSPVLAISAFAFFMMLIIRVIRNIFGKAVEMQEELDYTV